MDMHWTYEGCDEQDESQIENYWETRQLELEGKLASLADEPIELRMAVDRDDEPLSWLIMAALRLPGRTLVAEGSGRTAQGALDDVLRDLADEIDRLDETPASNHQREHEVETVLAMLERFRTTGRDGAFMSFLVPLVEELGSYAQRELQIREMEGRLPAEQITPGDVLNEVLVRAWNGFPNRPRSLAWNLWLVRLADEALDEFEQTITSQSLDDERPRPSTDVRESEEDEWIEQPAYPETIELSDLLPGVPGADSWDDLDLETKQIRLAELLGLIPRQQRQALVLHLADGFTVPEIADFQNRAQEQVAADIEAAKLTIRHRLLEREYDDMEDKLRRS